jgi:hypothetical protein
MDAVARGTIHDRERARQIRDFSGMIYGSITPTDVDGLIEYHDKCYVYFELKCKNNDLPRGQELAFLRMCDDLGKVKPTLLFVAEHETPLDQDIDVANSLVIKFRFGSKWYPVTKRMTAKEITTRFLERFGA